MRTAFVLVVALAAGCVTVPTSTNEQAPDAVAAFAPFVPPAPDFDFSTVIVPDHPSHQLPDLHMAGHGLELVGHAAISDIAPPESRASITQIDLWQNYAVVSGMEGGLAFAIVDLADPASPKAVSWYPSAADGWTARFSDDGNYVFYGCQLFSAPPFGLVYNPTSNVKGTCEDADAPHAPPAAEAGVVAVDVSDKANPTFAAFLPVGGSHNIFVTSINGTDYIFTASTAILKFDRAAGKLEQVAEVPGVHDATVARHPVTGKLLLFTGAAEGSFAIYDVSDPAAPEVVYEGGLEGAVGWHEQTLVPGLVDGRAVLALGGEHGTSTEGVMDAVSFVDVTDPVHPTLLSTWMPPFDGVVPWQGYLFSIHEMAATPTGQVAISWYHAGVWVLDVSTKERQAEPVTLAAYQPHELPNVVPSTFAQTPVPVVPFVWGAGWDARGYLVIPDMQTGVYVLEPEWGLHPALDGGQ
ncbi:MAG TPA: hypothetical protein VM370_09075 [Candidatus Thermoplasmatota archaeon]|nr:hypothetical protein [Candidatus Thermoplasmatota archaeon]